MAPTDKNLFEYQAPTDKQLEILKSLRALCKDLYDTMLEDLPESRYRSLAITKLEEVSMWQNKAVVFTVE